RGEGSIRAPGLDELVARTGVPVLGVVPWLEERLVAEEDALDLDALASGADDAPADAIEIAVVRLPRLANFDDFEPLAAEPGVRLRFVTTAAALRAADLVVLPGSKSTMADLAWLHATGLAAAVVGHADDGRGGPPRPRRLRRLPDARRGPPRSGARRVRAGSRGRARPPAGDDDLRPREDDGARQSARDPVGPVRARRGDGDCGVRDPRRTLGAHATRSAPV